MDNTPPELLPCADKMAFDTKSEAQTEANVLRWRRGTKLKVYKCRYCGLWHLSTHSTGSGSP